MQSMFNEVSIAVTLVAAIVVLFVWLRANLAAATAGRMEAMMTRVGVGPGIALQDRLRNDDVLRTVRDRCVRCPSEDLCDRWIAGTVEGDNAFCRKAATFSGHVATGARSG
jgi:hypothetical protein